MPDIFPALSTMLNARYSCRAFLPDPVPEETIQKVIQTAGRAPS